MYTLTVSDHNTFVFSQLMTKPQRNMNMTPAEEAKQIKMEKAKQSELVSNNTERYPTVYVDQAFSRCSTSCIFCVMSS